MILRRPYSLTPLVTPVLSATYPPPLKQNRMKLLATSLLVALLCISHGAEANIIDSIVGHVTSIFGTYEEPPYEVTRIAPGYEERKYPAKKWVCTASEANDARMMEPMFWRLFSYISGKNSNNELIPMTAPVTTEYTVLGATFKRFVMCFYLGEEHQGNAPAPSQADVFLQDRPELTVVTRTVGGYIETEAQWMEEAGKLAAIIQENGETVRLNHQYWVGYDPPLKFWSRRNEVWFPKH